MTATCAARYDDDTPDCARPATRHVTIVCVHEHIRDLDLCGSHGEAEGHCARCCEGPVPHECPLTFATEVGL